MGSFTKSELESDLKAWITWASFSILFLCLFYLFNNDHVKNNLIEQVKHKLKIHLPISFSKPCVNKKGEESHFLYWLLGFRKDAT